MPINSSKTIIKTLLSSKDRLLKHTKKIIIDHDFDYKTFGTAIEDYLLAEVINILMEKKIIKTESDYHRAENKNEFPDLKILKPKLLALEVKSGNHSRKKGGKWVICKNSNNDMGTLNSWDKKIKEFGGENIFYIFVEYNFNTTKKILDIKIAPFYSFLAFNKDGLLRYREKDGNLRPKDFDKLSPIKSYEDFEKLFSKTVIYRSGRIIRKHLKYIPAEERKKFLKELTKTLSSAVK